MGKNSKRKSRQRKKNNGFGIFVFILFILLLLIGILGLLHSCNPESPSVEEPKIEQEIELDKTELVFAGVSE